MVFAFNCCAMQNMHISSYSVAFDNNTQPNDANKNHKHTYRFMCKCICENKSSGNPDTKRQTRKRAVGHKTGKAQSTTAKATTTANEYNYIQLIYNI